ncbi:hypothetical protein ACH429_25600 [Streptomyces pathocidini]|uniref:Uncharacterized protein n=1 Tax=Streptomyces pathocidini TaxID=1650571 RepID=A0ABW7UXW9_9ACTN|nr:hypothetical protein [Streptomyces pathocidini]
MERDLIDLHGTTGKCTPAHEERTLSVIDHKTRARTRSREEVISRFVNKASVGILIVAVLGENASLQERLDQFHALAL